MNAASLEEYSYKLAAVDLRMNLPNNILGLFLL